MSFEILIPFEIIMSFEIFRSNYAKPFFNLYRINVSNNF